MSTVLHKKTLDVLYDVLAYDYMRDPNCIIDPDMSAVEDVPKEYWVIRGSLVVPCDDYVPPRDIPDPKPVTWVIPVVDDNFDVRDED